MLRDGERERDIYTGDQSWPRSFPRRYLQGPELLLTKGSLRSSNLFTRRSFFRERGNYFFFYLNKSTRTKCCANRLIKKKNYRARSKLGQVSTQACRHRIFKYSRAPWIHIANLTAAAVISRGAREMCNSNELRLVSHSWEVGAKRSDMLIGRRRRVENRREEGRGGCNGSEGWLDE